MVGNVGHARRLEYTAVGDTVNTASRIEGLTKGTPYSLFIAESTYKLLAGNASGLEYVDEFEVRGRKQTLKIWVEPRCLWRRQARVRMCVQPCLRQLHFAAVRCYRRSSQLHDLSVSRSSLQLVRPDF
jgi:hypothetical protein